MKLFEDYAALNAQRMCFPVAPDVPVTAATFEAWPEHTRTEFTLLLRERGISQREACNRTGIATAALEAASMQAHRYALPQVSGHHYDEDRPMSRQHDAETRS